MSIYLAAALAIALSAPAPPPGDAVAGEADALGWLAEDAAGVVRLRLAHAEAVRPDGGTLVVDPNRKVLEWQGAPGENGCRRVLEVPFARVRAMRAEPQGVLRLELRGEGGSWEFVPLPHVAWLTGASKAIARGFLPDLRDTFVTGSDDTPMPASGSAAFMGAQVRADLVPAEVAADVRLAAEVVRKALGRPALPAASVYEALHGAAVAVPLEELASSAAALEGRAVRVRGVVETRGGRDLALVEGDARVRIVPQPETEAVVRAAARGWPGEEIEVTGVVRRTGGATGEPGHTVAFWQFEGPDRESVTDDDVRSVSVRNVVERPAALAGVTVRVVGKFRGRNLFGDLAGPAPRGGWVLKSRRHAVWVTGHRPAGPGFRLNPDLERDTTQWLEVVGTVDNVDGHAVVRARTVSLALPQTFVWNGPRLRPDPHPEVVFTLPLLEEEASPRDGRLLVQWSAYMDEETFAGRVRVLLGRGDWADREARRARLTYDDVRRVLIVDPGEPLPAGGVVEVRLLPGIEDVYGAIIVPAAEAPPDGAVRVLRWRVAAPAGDEATP